MQYYIAPGDRPAFYVDDVHGLKGEESSKVPGTAIAISTDLYESLHAGQAVGKIITFAIGDAAPTLQDPPASFYMAALRTERDRRLALTDWTQAGDVPAATKAKYQPYRQALRDLPENVTDPKPGNFDWPALPT